MTENEQKVIKKISDLSGDYKCYDNRINHEESLVLDRLLTEIQAYRAIGTVEELQSKLEAYRELGTMEELKALKEGDIPIIHGKAELELHDAEIRAKAIDEFAERLGNLLVLRYGNATPTEQYVAMQVTDWCVKIAEQLKGGAE